MKTIVLVLLMISGGAFSASEQQQRLEWCSRSCDGAGLNRAIVTGDMITCLCKGEHIGYSVVADLNEVDRTMRASTTTAELLLNIILIGGSWVVINLILGTIIVLIQALYCRIQYLKTDEERFSWWKNLGNHYDNDFWPRFGVLTIFSVFWIVIAVGCGISVTFSGMMKGISWLFKKIFKAMPNLSLDFFAALFVNPGIMLTSKNEKIRKIGENRTKKKERKSK